MDSDGVRNAGGPPGESTGGPPGEGPGGDLFAGLGRAHQLLRDSPVFVLTGAGMSTDSGIPDYRGPDSPPRTPMTYSTFRHDERARARYWARSFVGWTRFRAAEPNLGHATLAAVQDLVPLTGVVTQNVDGLHEAAGSRDVIDLHGRLNQIVCLDCHNVFDRVSVHHWLEAANPDFVARLPELLADSESAPDGDAEVDRTEGFRVVACPICSGTLKPDVVFFGENVPKYRVAAANGQLESSSSVLVLGSSLTVMSGLRFVRAAAKRELPIVIVNRGSTRADDIAVVRLNLSVTEFLLGWQRSLGG